MNHWYDKVYVSGCLVTGDGTLTPETRVTTKPSFTNDKSRGSPLYLIRVD